MSTFWFSTPDGQTHRYNDLMKARTAAVSAANRWGIPMSVHNENRLRPQTRSTHHPKGYRRNPARYDNLASAYHSYGRDIKNAVKKLLPSRKQTEKAVAGGRRKNAAERGAPTRGAGHKITYRDASGQKTVHAASKTEANKIATELRNYGVKEVTITEEFARNPIPFGAIAGGVASGAAAAAAGKAIDHAAQKMRRNPVKEPKYWFGGVNKYTGKTIDQYFHLKSELVSFYRVHGTHTVKPRMEMRDAKGNWKRVII